MLSLLFGDFLSHTRLSWVVALEGQVWRVTFCLLVEGNSLGSLHNQINLIAKDFIDTNKSKRRVFICIVFQSIKAIIIHLTLITNIHTY